MTDRHNKTRILYWVSTLLFVVPLTWSAVQYFIEAPRMMQTMTHLGYPIYFTKILGTAKVLGVLAILYGRMPLLKEWAYAGFTFDLLGAAASHLSSGDSIFIAMVPLAFLVLMTISYRSWKKLAGRTRSLIDTAPGTHSGRRSAWAT